jgi:uncharacterized membrane protein
MKLCKSYFSASDLNAIKQACECAEENTSGEVKVSIVEKRPHGTAKLSLTELASMEFMHLGMEKTRDRTGVLLFILLSERQFQILADKGINAKVEQKIWDEIAGQMANKFKNGEYLSGVLTAVKSIGEVLAKWFPRKADDTNELTDEVHVA